MKTIAIPMIASGLVAASIPLAGTASAYCDTADCVPNVTANVAGRALLAAQDLRLRVERGRRHLCVQHGWRVGAGRPVDRYV